MHDQGITIVAGTDMGFPPQADLILVEGDPLTRIRDIRNVSVVIKDGKVYDPAVLHAQAGFGK